MIDGLDRGARNIGLKMNYNKRKAVTNVSHQLERQEAK